MQNSQISNLDPNVNSPFTGRTALRNAQILCRPKTYLNTIKSNPTLTFGRVERRRFVRVWLSPPNVTVSLHSTPLHSTVPEYKCLVLHYLYQYKGLVLHYLSICHQGILFSFLCVGGKEKERNPAFAAVSVENQNHHRVPTINRINMDSHPPFLPVLFPSPLISQNSQFLALLLYH